MTKKTTPIKFKSDNVISKEVIEARIKDYIAANLPGWKLESQDYGWFIYNEDFYNYHTIRFVHSTDYVIGNNKIKLETRGARFIQASEKNLDKLLEKTLEMVAQWRANIEENEEEHARASRSREEKEEADETPSDYSKHGRASSGSMPLGALTTPAIKLAGIFGKYAGIETMREAKQALHAKDAQIEKANKEIANLNEFLDRPTLDQDLPPGQITDEQLEFARMTGAKIATLEDTLITIRHRLDNYHPGEVAKIRADITNALSFSGRE